jgi:hypothetical protein
VVASGIVSPICKSMDAGAHSAASARVAIFFEDAGALAVPRCGVAILAHDDALTFAAAPTVPSTKGEISIVNDKPDPVQSAIVTGGACREPWPM